LPARLRCHGMPSQRLRKVHSTMPLTDLPSLPGMRDPPLPKAATYLPSPPSDVEKYWYMGRQHRWLLIVQALSFALIGVSIFRFSTSDVRLLLFLAPMSLFTITLCISLSSSLRGKRTDRVDHELRVVQYNPAVYSSIDVFLPSAGEPMEVLANTYEHVQKMEWSAEIAVWVLDDSGRDSVRELAEAHGFSYRSRPDRGHLKKAGNLRHGYEQSSNDFIVIFDADFVPRTDFLRELMPYFQEPDVGIVQSPQFFDAHKGMRWLQRSAGAAQELFYRWIQPARDRSRAAICVGSCAIYRREALEKSGGFAQIGHSEDVHTGVNLMKTGYQLRYIPILVSKGICPDNLLGFVNQQYRWCTGSMSLLADKTFHNAPHISARQRLCFWAGFLYYISTAVNVFTTALPALAMIWLLPDFIFLSNSLYLVGALTLWILIVPLTMRTRWRIEVLRVQTVYSFAHALAIYHILRGQTKEWVATGAANAGKVTPLAVSITRLMKVWVGVTHTLIWAGLLYDMWLYGPQRFWAMAVFALIAGYVQLPLLWQSTKPEVKPRLSHPAPAAVTGVREGIGVDEGVGVREETRTRQLAKQDERLAPRLSEPATPGLVGTLAPRKWRPDIQGLRAVAVLLVILYHAHVPFIPGGYVGVDVFFVISGFLITGTLVHEVAQTGKISFVNFYAGRFKRLALPAALVVVVTLVADRIWASLFQVRPLAMDAIFTSLYGINYRFAQQGVDYQHASAAPSPLQHYWSLAVEEQFYLTWPLLIMLCVWLARRHHYKAVIGTIAVVTAVSLYYCVNLTATDQPMAYFSLHTRAWELGLGALTAMLARYLVHMPGWLASSMSWAGLAGIVATGLVYTDNTLFPGSAAIVPVVATAMVIAAGCRQSRRSAEFLLAQRPMQGIGKVSYAWYLWHWPLLLIIPMKFGYDLPWGFQVEIMILALWLAVLTYYLLEKPTARSRFRRPMWLTAGPLTAGAAIGVAGLVLLSLPPLVGTGAAVTVKASDTAGIMHAVAKGTLTVAAPGNLTPSLAEVKGDQPSSTRNGCHAGFLTVQQGMCVYGDPAGTHTMVLMGDSHAQQWLPTLDAEAKTKHWKLISWTKAACPAAQVTIQASQLGNRTYTECDEWRRITLSRVEGLHPDVLLIAQSDSVPGYQYTTNQWADATARTLNEVRQTGTPVIYMMDTPVPRHNIPDCISNNLDDVTKCMFLRKDAYSFAGRHEAMAATLKAINITTVDPIDWFCNSRKCPPVIGNYLVYRDGSHLSTPYSRWLAPATAGLFVPKAPGLPGGN
jgi:peptidoglycan/LPS O-acetylase OafA/YrhL/cellulose synthase/poly-beta-1,6-N-acetylglucosamine synthase-like glycosyltransferase